VLYRKYQNSEVVLEPPSPLTAVRKIIHIILLYAILGHMDPGAVGYFAQGNTERHFVLEIALSL
jgi:N-acetylmuramoyl-L-alanine amidase